MQDREDKAVLERMFGKRFAKGYADKHQDPAKQVNPPKGKVLDDYNPFDKDRL